MLHFLRRRRKGYQDRISLSCSFLLQSIPQTTGKRQEDALAKAMAVAAMTLKVAEEQYQIRSTGVDELKFAVATVVTDT